LPGNENMDLQKKLTNVVEPFVMNFVKEAKGSISIEHGIGKQRASFQESSKSKPMIDYMKKIKSVFDPN
jgi:FAD/FMN-containing dehydrogenase